MIYQPHLIPAHNLLDYNEAMYQPCHVRGSSVRLHWVQQLGTHFLTILKTLAFYYLLSHITYYLLFLLLAHSLHLSCFTKMRCVSWVLIYQCQQFTKSHSSQYQVHTKYHTSVIFRKSSLGRSSSYIDRLCFFHEARDRSRLFFTSTVGWDRQRTGGTPRELNGELGGVCVLTSEIIGIDPLDAVDTPERYPPPDVVASSERRSWSGKW